MAPDLASAVAAFERNFKTVTDETANQMVGAGFMPVLSGGVVKLGEPAPALYHSASDAIQAWRVAASAYAASAPIRGHLRWAVKPYLDRFVFGMGETYWFVYSQMLISGNAPAPPHAPSMHKWACHKVVSAAPIIEAVPAIVSNDRRGRSTPYIAFKIDPVHPERLIQPVPDDFFARGVPKPGDYLIRYEDGYLSWSPKKAFEDGYKLVTPASDFDRRPSINASTRNDSVPTSTWNNEPAQPIIAGKDDNDQA